LNIKNLLCSHHYHNVQKVCLNRAFLTAVFAYSIVWLDHRFSPSTDIAGHTPVKQSVQRQIRAAVLSQWKIEPETLEAIWPKKEGLVHVKWSAQPVFFPHHNVLIHVP
jgi:Pre-PUA-like domain